MNIYFHIDEFNRDAIVASALKKRLVDTDHRIIYGNRLSNRVLKYFHRAFDIIVLPRPHFLYDNWGDDWLEWNCKFVMLSTENLGIICKDHRVMARTLLEKDYFEGDKKYTHRIDAFCVWGKKQRNAICEYAPELIHKFHVVGHPRHDSSCFVSLKENSQKNKIVIGITPRAVGLNDYFGRSALDSFSTMLDSHFQYEYQNLKTGEEYKSTRVAAYPAENTAVQAIDVGLILEIVKEIECNSLEVEIQIRPHPKENLNVWQNLLSKGGLKAKLVSSREPITHWLNSIDYLVGPPSTTFYDAIMRGTTPISIEAIDKRRKLFISDLWEDNNRLMPYIYKPSSIPELVAYIKKRKKLIFDDSIAKVLKEEANFPDCESSLKKFCDVLVSFTIPNRFGVTKHINLLGFFLARIFFNNLWLLRSLLINRRPNSTMFVVNRKASSLIDKMTQP